MSVCGESDAGRNAKRFGYLLADPIQVLPVVTDYLRHQILNSLELVRLRLLEYLLQKNGNSSR